MPSDKRIQFTITIAAPVERVFETMISDAGYRVWIAPFGEGSYYEGSWAQGQRIRFLSPSGHGLVAEIAENLPNRFISIRHLGYIVDGVEDTASDAVLAWAPAYENYSFDSVAEGTRIVVGQDVNDELEPFMMQAWPLALEQLKALCESRLGAA